MPTPFRAFDPARSDAENLTCAILTVARVLRRLEKRSAGVETRLEKINLTLHDLEQMLRPLADPAQARTVEVKNPTGPEGQALPLTLAASPKASPPPGPPPKPAGPEGPPLPVFEPPALVDAPQTQRNANGKISPADFRARLYRGWYKGLTGTRRAIGKARWPQDQKASMWTLAQEHFYRGKPSGPPTSEHNPYLPAVPQLPADTSSAPPVPQPERPLGRPRKTLSDPPQAQVTDRALPLAEDYGVNGLRRQWDKLSYKEKGPLNRDATRELLTVAAISYFDALAQREWRSPPSWLPDETCLRAQFGGTVPMARLYKLMDRAIDMVKADWADNRIQPIRKSK